MKKRVKRILIGASVTVTALVASVAALVLLVFGGFYALMWHVEAPQYNPERWHQLCMNEEKLAVTCEPLEIEYAKYDAELVCGAMGIDSWNLKFLARWESYREETAITVWLSDWDYIKIYENDTAQAYWYSAPRWYSLPEGTYQKVYEQIQELDALPDTEDLG